MNRVCLLSRYIHDWFFPDYSQSLCSRAWQMQNHSLAWKLWTYAFGRRHCRASYRRYHGKGRHE